MGNMGNCGGIIEISGVERGPYLSLAWSTVTFHDSLTFSYWTRLGSAPGGNEEEEEAQEEEEAKPKEEAGISAMYLVEGQ